MLNLPPHERLAMAFRERVHSGELPPPGHNLTLASVCLAPADLVHIFESQLMSRHLDYAARRLGQEKRGFYSIGSAGHEGNAGVAHLYRSTDMAFLHYRSGAFLIERLRNKPGATPLWDMALSFVAGAEDPVSGGRHKVLGSLEMFVPPQTSTIASHLPKAVGTGFAVTLARMLKADFSAIPHDSVVIASFGDASVNHSTAVGALNTAA
ncbi:MAG: thiamine pyrophosphate-dependent enzyme, partial [Gammaproteobacteria bacterium]|nr:thiamine pyrophosphate-dependent enzyme [Gammaproteobacteria bacterium]